MGGFFFDFEPMQTASGPGSESTGETSSTLPERGHRRSDAAAGRQSMRRRRDGGPGRLEQLGRSRAGPADRTGRRLCGAQRPDAVEQTGRQPLRHRRDACDVAPRFTGVASEPLRQCSVCGAALIKRAAMVASWHRCVILRGRCVRLVIDAARLSSRALRLLDALPAREAGLRRSSDS